MKPSKGLEMEKESLDYQFALALYNKASLRCNENSKHIDIALSKLREADRYKNRPKFWRGMAGNAFLAIKWLDNPDIEYYNYWTKEDENNFETARKEWIFEWKRLNGWQIA